MASSLRESGSVILDGSGNGAVTLTPGMLDWVITRTTITVESTTAEPTFKLYESNVNAADFLEGTWVGSLSTSDTTHLVRSGQALIGVWTGGDPGASATLIVRGVAYPPGQAPVM